MISCPTCSVTVSKERNTCHECGHRLQNDALEMRNFGISSNSSASIKSPIAREPGSLASPDSIEGHSTATLLYPDRDKSGDIHSSDAVSKTTDNKTRQLKAIIFVVWIIAMGSILLSFYMVITFNYYILEVLDILLGLVVLSILLVYVANGLDDGNNLARWLLLALLVVTLLVAAVVETIFIHDRWANAVISLLGLGAIIFIFYCLTLHRPTVAIFTTTSE